MNILVPLATGCEEMESISIIDILKRANLNVQTASLDDKDCIKCAHGTIIKADYQLKNINIENLAGIVIPGGLGGKDNCLKSSLLKEIVKTLNTKGKMLAAICAGPIVLDSFGVKLESYTCYPSCENFISNPQSRIDEAVVVNKNIITGAGPAVAQVFALEIVKYLLGEEMYQNIKNQTVSQYLEKYYK